MARISNSRRDVLTTDSGEPPSTQIVGYFLDACAVAFIGIGLDTLEREGLSQKCVGNLALGLVVGLAGISWRRIARRLPRRLVETAVLVTTDFRWWLITMLCLGLYFALPTGVLSSVRPGAWAQTPKLISLGVTLIGTLGGPDFGANAHFAASGSAPVYGGNQTGIVTIENHALSRNEIGAIFDDFLVQLNNASPTHEKMLPGEVIWKTYKPAVELSKADADDVMAGKKRLYIFAAASFSEDENERKNLNAVETCTFYSGNLIAQHVCGGYENTVVPVAAKHE